MSFERVYRASIYVMLFLATLIMSIDAGRDNRFAMLYPFGVAIFGAIAFLTVDRDPKRGLPRDVANFLAFVGAGLGLLEWYNDPYVLLLALGHTLVYLSVVKFSLPKTVEDDWFLFLLGLVQVVIAVIMSQSDEVVMLLLTWAGVTLWSFGLFHLRRESLRGGPPVGVSILPAPNRSEPYPGLLNFSFVMSTLRVAALTLAMGAFLFPLLPRYPVRGGETRQGAGAATKHLTGFSTSVTLGGMGDLLENDSIVMTVEMTDENDHSVQTDEEPLWRGVTLVTYNKGEWSREDVRPMTFDNSGRTAAPNGREIRQRIKLEPTDSDALFAIRPILSVRTARSEEVGINPYDGTLLRRDPRTDPLDGGRSRTSAFDYLVRSARASNIPQPGEFHSRGSSVYSDLPDEELRGRLLEVSRPVITALPPSDRNSAEKKARALERFLRDGEYTYTLKMSIEDDSLDPVIDFLVNRKSGHCEYFASALTLLCRAEGIPSRMVNGFKGGDWSALGGVYTVREKHAHSWVEVLVSEDGETAATWITLDPTPSRQREEVVAQVGGGISRSFRPIGDVVRNFLAFYVVGFDFERQERWIYGPLRYLWGLALSGFAMMWARIKEIAALFYFEDITHFFSVRGFIVSVATMLTLLGLILALRRVYRSLSGRRSRLNGTIEDRDPGLAFYQRMVRALATLGLERPPGETPREFARRAELSLAGRVESGLDLSTIPSFVVDAFYSKRFGLTDLPPDRLSDLEHRVDALETSLSTPRSG